MTSSTSPAHGAWPSPISAALVAEGAQQLTQLTLGGRANTGSDTDTGADTGADTGMDIFVLAGRASEGGRNTLLRQRGQDVFELTPAPLNVRNRVHEYGGGAYAIDGDAVYFSNFSDDRIYLQRGAAPALPLTAPAGGRWADFIVDRGRARLIGVRELHPASGHDHPTNSICAIDVDNGQATVLVEGSDFYAAPRLSPDGMQLAWLSWDHPRMPWQGTQLWLADVRHDGTLGPARQIAGGSDIAICQPQWSPSGALHFVSDSSGWWNLYRLADGKIAPLCPMQAEFATPHWTFGVSMYGFCANGDIVCTYLQDGVSHLARLHAGALTPIPNPYQEIRELRVGPGFVALLGGAPTLALELSTIDLASGELTVLARSINDVPDARYLSIPASIRFAASGGRIAHAFFYPPKNDDVKMESGSLPPVIVISHGGPTSMASNTLKLATQYWTSRGFGVLDVNYGGSSGFGRAYRDALKGQWGIVDVDDCIAGARHLVENGLADFERLIIRGGSAGGLTTLCALTFHDVFKAGASYYGVSDLKGLDLDSHKFESRYNQYLIGPAPQAEALYLARSPIHHSGRLKRPMIFFQGQDDKVVPPQQSAMMFEALKARGVPVAYLPLAGEGHGFRKAENIALTLQAEWYFYQRVFGLAAHDCAAPVQIHNLPA
jgi:dipeptidyl aminopeptidase/acylaminoacyl peptidase